MPKERKPRPHGSGSITERKDGRFQGAYYTEDGKRHYIYTKTGPACNKKLMAKIREQEEKAARPRRVLLKDFTDIWIKSRLDYRANSSTQRQDCIENHINRDLGEYELSEITREVVIAWVEKLAKTLAPATVKSNYVALSATLGEAVARGLLQSSPCYKIKLPRIEKTEHTILSLEQGKQLTDKMDHWIVPIIKLALATAMRESELLALKWSDVDLTRGVITIRHNVAYIAGEGHVPGPPKTRASARTISLAPFAQDVLKAHRVSQMATRDIWEKGNLVFPHESGGYRTPQSLRYHLKRMIERADVPRVTFHELRHSAVSILIALGVNIIIIQELCGHSSIVTTLGLYGHLLPNAQEGAMKQLDAAWRQKDVKTDAEDEEKRA
jgi:integrase